MNILVFNVVLFVICGIGIIFVSVSLCWLFRICMILRTRDGAEDTYQPRYDPVRRKILDKIAYTFSRMRSQRSRAFLHMINKDQDNICSICLDPFCPKQVEVEGRGKDIGLLHECGHYFHFDCIWRWIESNSSCPICRKSVPVSSKTVKAISVSLVLPYMRNLSQSGDSQTDDANKAESTDIAEVHVEQRRPSEDSGESGHNPARENTSHRPQVHREHGNEQRYAGGANRFPGPYDDISPHSSSRRHSSPHVPRRHEPVSPHHSPRRHRHKSRHQDHDRRRHRSEQREREISTHPSARATRSMPYVIQMPMPQVGMNDIMMAGPSYYSQIYRGTSVEWQRV